MAAAIYIDNYKPIKRNMNNNRLFAVDLSAEDVIVSESSKGSNKINFIKRIGRQDNELLYDAVVTLTRITNSSNFDSVIFKAMDKVCQMIYNKHEEDLNSAIK
jgi:hypothetical protein